MTIPILGWKDTPYEYRRVEGGVQWRQPGGDWEDVDAIEVRCFTAAELRLIADLLDPTPKEAPSE